MCQSVAIDCIAQLCQHCCFYHYFFNIPYLVPIDFTTPLVIQAVWNMCDAWCSSVVFTFLTNFSHAYLMSWLLQGS